MRGILAVPKKRLDELVRVAKETSPRNGNPHAPGQKRVKKRKSRPAMRRIASPKKQRQKNQ